MSDRVTQENWAELQAQGFEHLSNLGGTGDMELEISDSRYITDLYRKYDEDDVKVGDAWNSDTGLPDAELSARERIVGVYARRH